MACALASPRRVGHSAGNRWAAQEGGRVLSHNSARTAGTESHLSEAATAECHAGWSRADPAEPEWRNRGPYPDGTRVLPCAQEGGEAAGEAFSIRFTKALGLDSRIDREGLPKHRVPALGLLPRHFILDDVPVLHEKPTFDPKDIRRDPVHGCSESREPPVDDHDIPLRHDHPRLVFQR